MQLGQFGDVLHDYADAMPRMRPLPRLVWPFLIGLFLAACSATTGATTSGQPAADLVVTMNEWRFAPREVVVEVERPAVVELRNSGAVLHEWAVVDGRVTTEADLGGVEVLARLKVNAGDVARLELPALRPGVYDVVCPIPGHIANGMVGTLTVGE